VLAAKKVFKRNMFGTLLGGAAKISAKNFHKFIVNLTDNYYIKR
jgi:hypothetical protein